MLRKAMTNELRTKIQQYIKNGADISDLIKDYSIKGEDLSRAIIANFDRPDDDMTGTNFCQAVIGKEGKITNLNRVVAHNCNFHRAKFLGKIWARHSDWRGSNCKEIHVTDMDYKFADLRNCDFCNAMFCIGSGRGIGAKFDEDFFKDLGENWGIEVKFKKVEETKADKEEESKEL